MSAGQLAGQLFNPQMTMIMKTTMTLDAVRDIIGRESDVKQVVELEQVGDRVRYLIETPFATFPRFVVGSCTRNVQDVCIEMSCGALESAMDAWRAAAV